MKKEKNIAIRENLFVAIYKLVNLIKENVEIPVELFDEIDNGLEEKIAALTRHKLYSQYKFADNSPSEREKARQKYLDSIGIPKDFQW